MISRSTALRILRRHEAELKARGIRCAGIFGSVSRGDAQVDSDLDVLIELDRAHRFNVFEFVGIKRPVAALFPGRVDVVNIAALKPGVGGSMKRDLVYAF